MLESSLWIALGGASRVTRFWLAELVGRFVDRPFPWATVITNITGTSSSVSTRRSAGPRGGCPTPVARQFVMVGICGGYTTFSAFSLADPGPGADGDLAARRGQYRGVGRAVPGAVWLGRRRRRDQTRCR